jgi:Fic family protein
VQITQYGSLFEAYLSKIRLMIQNSLIWQQPDWPHLTFDAASLLALQLKARRLQGEVVGQASSIGLDRFGVMNELLAQEVLATAAIEGEMLDPSSVRSSILRKLGVEVSSADSVTGQRNRHVDGLIDVIQDASVWCHEPLDDDRLCRWQSALFPGGTSGIHRIAVGRYRDHADAMQIVSGSPGREVVHYTAPPSAQVSDEMQAFLSWFADSTPVTGVDQSMDGVARAAVAHLWFETIHPFEDGNGRIGRAIVDMALAQDLGAQTRLYSISSQIGKNRRGYYEALKTAQHGLTDITPWVQWFLEEFCCACQASMKLIDQAIEKSRFWAQHSQTSLNLRQRKVIQRLLDDGDGGFLGGMSTAKYVKMTGASKATATRDLTDLLQEGLLFTRGQGKSSRYFVAVPGWEHEANELPVESNALPIPTN